MAVNQEVGEPPENLKREAENSSEVAAQLESAANGSQAPTNGESQSLDIELESSEPPSKRQKLEQDSNLTANEEVLPPARVKGTASIKAEYLIPSSEFNRNGSSDRRAADDDAAESQPRDGERGKKKEKKRGQNTARQFGSSRDIFPLCSALTHSNEFSPKPCRFGDKCSFSHDLRKYLKAGKRGDLKTFGGKCPIFEAYGRCNAGWKCRFSSSHSREVELSDGRKELQLITNLPDDAPEVENEDEYPDIVNVVSTQSKLDLQKRKMKTEKAEQYTEWLAQDGVAMELHHNHKKAEIDLEDQRAKFTEPPFKPSEKRRIYFGPETPVLAPLTTQGNLPFRRLCVELGAELTYSEMAMSMPLIQGTKGEWALMKAHQSEVLPPRVSPRPGTVVESYDNSQDLRFGAQISAPKPWQALKATEALSRLVPHLRVIDLNCGCPIDLVYQTGAGSALLDTPGKLERIIRGMNAVSGPIPITAKIRMGTRDDSPNALKNIERLALGSLDTRERLGAPGCAALTLHGRSRQQRYTRSANWEYVAECAALIKSFNKRRDEVTDTIREPDESTLPNGNNGMLYFLGNGDCYSHVDYLEHVEKAGVDSVMIGRGALIKPWLFEEIQAGQYLDKSASERLTYVEKFARYGMQAWGSDEIGIGQTRRFLLEWLSFAHRYVPVGILEHLPPSLQDRPPAYRGRNELETLMASDNFKDWIKISEMFLGPSHKDFKFTPKHKSHSYEIQAEG